MSGRYCLLSIYRIWMGFIFSPLFLLKRLNVAFMQGILLYVLLYERREHGVKIRQASLFRIDACHLRARVVVFYSLNTFD